MAETGENDAYHEVKFSQIFYNLYSYMVSGNLTSHDHIFRVHLRFLVFFFLFFFFFKHKQVSREESHVYCLLMKHLT